ncbi:MAG: phosphonate ABC transporter ATP-binding protein, partial [Endozoicomonas sp.]
RSRVALENISFSIAPGEMVALIGPSGSGKSTLLRHLSGLCLSDPGTQSSIAILGQTIQKAGRIDRHIRKHRARIGLIFQQFNLVRRLSVIHNVMLGGLGRMPWYRSFFSLFNQDEKRQALAALERVGLADFAWQRASELSGGQQQRVAIARALMQKAEVILADEPVASLDPASARQVMSILNEVCQKDGITVLVTLHQVEHAREWCQRMIALRKGEIFLNQPAADVDARLLSELYSLEADQFSASASTHTQSQSEPAQAHRHEAPRDFVGARKTRHVA